MCEGLKEAQCSADEEKPGNTENVHRCNVVSNTLLLKETVNITNIIGGFSLSGG